MNDILNEKAKIWTTRLKLLMKKKGYTQESFLKEYKEKYGNCTQANVSRWLRVRKPDKEGINNDIGFPKYETMVKIADMFGVSVGYLTGETNFETFQLEQACQLLGIDEKTAKEIKSISSGEIGIFSKYKKSELAKTLKFLITSNCFHEFILSLQEQAENIFLKEHRTLELDRLKSSIDKETFEQALKYTIGTDDQYGSIDDFKENGIEPIENLVQVMKLVNKAIDHDFGDQDFYDFKVKVTEYELQKIYFRLIDEVLLEEHLLEMVCKSYKSDMKK
ncbi:helix-turn-helix domain-containing protein [Dubosiella newyorkensis]|uniref:HTH cro/C1-type domain-containing protein n=1 Tax=Dubosiella newyorkensis TaxID=1862672 RepID=A0A1U7NN15_9FIRM|nr:helix-turn-helix transcriptional regulator [Dubosiella newyorkensis]OLU46682.1 hypothetical protein BO225_05820 [Dubosiella newyorkensis]